MTWAFEDLSFRSTTAPMRASPVEESTTVPFAVTVWAAALKDPKPTAKETPYEPMPENVEEIVAQAKGAH